MQNVEDKECLTAEALRKLGSRSQNLPPIKKNIQPTNLLGSKFADLYFNIIDFETEYKVKYSSANSFPKYMETLRKSPCVQERIKIREEAENVLEDLEGNEKE